MPQPKIDIVLSTHDGDPETRYNIVTLRIDDRDVMTTGGYTDAWSALLEMTRRLAEMVASDEPRTYDFVEYGGKAGN